MFFLAKLRRQPRFVASQPHPAHGRGLTISSMKGYGSDVRKVGIGATPEAAL